MVYKARLLLSGRQKIALALLLLVVVGFLMNYPRVTEALLAFLLGGQVPGTNIILSPDVVLMVVLAVFIIGTASLILRMYFKAARSKRNFRIAVQSIESEVILPVARNKAVASGVIEPKAGVAVQDAVRKRHTLAMFMLTTVRHISHGLVIAWGRISGTMYAISSATRLAINAVMNAVWRGLSFGAEVLYTLAVLIWFGIGHTVKFTYKLIRTSAKITRRIGARAWVGIVQTVRAFWRWSRPRFKRLDSWLELHVRQIENRIGKLLSRHETVRTVASMGHEYRKSMHELHPKTVLKSANRKAGNLKTKIISAHGHSRRPAKVKP